MAQFNPDTKQVLDELLAEYPQIHRGKMFGYPAYYAGKKLCLCLYEEGVGVKLPEKTVQKLLATDTNVSPFQPLGRGQMREWVQINLSRAEDYRQYRSVFEESIRFVLEPEEK
jgi:hypothetical protein